MKDRRYFIDMCKPLPRVYVDNPPKAPKGRVYEVTHEQYVKMERYSRRLWVEELGGVRVRNVMANPTHLMHYRQKLQLQAALIGALIGTVFGFIVGIVL